jgi:transposase-like protein
MFQDEDKAREALEAVRWPEGPICPHCGSSDPDKLAKIEGTKKSHRPGLYYCNDCKGQFTVTVGTVFERSKVPLTKWWMATHMMNSGKNGVSAQEIHRSIGVTYKTAWFMMHRLREAMIATNPGPMGATGGNVQADETYHLNTSKRAKGYKRSTSPLARRSAITKTMNHTGREYVNKLGFTTNNVENFFGVFKRGMRGTYTFCGEQHLQRYLTEFQFRYNNRSGLGVSDGERTALALKGIEGKRLTYRPTN